MNGTNDSAQPLKLNKHYDPTFSPEQRALYNQYKTQYVKQRRLNNLEAERERMRLYMRQYRQTQKAQRSPNIGMAC